MAAAELPPDPADWSVDGVCVWARENGCDSDPLRAAAVDGFALLRLQKDRLRDIGFESLAERKQLWKSLQALRLRLSDQTPTLLSPQGPACAADTDSESSRRRSTQSPDVPLSCGYSSYSAAWSYGSCSSTRSSSVWSDLSSVHSDAAHRSSRRVRPLKAVVGEGVCLEAAEVLKGCCGGAVTPTSFADLILRSAVLCERAVAAVLVGLVPSSVAAGAAATSAQTTLSHGAAKLLSVYGVTSSEATLTLRSASSMLRSGGALHRFVYDALRVTDGIVPVRSRTQPLSQEDAAVVAQVFQIHQLLPPPDLDASSLDPSAATPPVQPRRQRLRLRSAVPAPAPSRCRLLAAALRRCVRRAGDVDVGGVSVRSLAAALCVHEQLAKRLWEAVVAAASRTQHADPTDDCVDRRRSVVSSLLSAYDVLLPADDSGTADWLTAAFRCVKSDAKSWERFVGDALKVCHGVDRRRLVAEPLSDADLAAFSHNTGLSDLLLPQDGASADAAAEPAAFTVGSRVRVVSDEDAVRSAVAATERLGWQDGMHVCCGGLGRVKRYDPRDRRKGWVQVMHDSGEVWTWPVAVVEAL